MYYSNGNYEAFARPKKPEGVDDKNAYIIGHWFGRTHRGLLPGARRANAGQPHSRIRKGRGSGRSLRRREYSRCRLCDARPAVKWTTISK